MNKGLIPSKNYLLDEQKLYKNKYPAQLNDIFVKIDDDDTPGFLSEKFIEGTFRLINTPLGSKQIEFITDNSNVGYGLYRNIVGELEIDYSTFIDKEFGTLAINIDTDFPEFFVKLQIDGGLKTDVVNGISIKSKNIDILKTDIDGLFLNLNDFFISTTDGLSLNIATQSEVNAGISTNTVLTPFSIKNTVKEIAFLYHNVTIQEITITKTEHNFNSVKGIFVYKRIANGWESIVPNFQLLDNGDIILLESTFTSLNSDVKVSVFGN